MSDGIWMSSEDLEEIDAQAASDGEEIERLVAQVERLETAIASAAGLFNHLVMTGQMTEEQVGEIDAWLNRYEPSE
ncbi:hypothetical protein [Glycomyces terrestris]|uniref:Uncharacterized protein n=1 Tax=Glycomyces terrestris TaxID=2493553 RepID=A0A426URB2_9ACTN|nr:hypothetical protein [Glycomyces terrestris]RRR95548.1 hypothetical protein EIW28_23855 [Glycomyces terrestris]